MSTPQVPGPDLPWGTVIHNALGVEADGDDTGLHPDLSLIAGLRVTLIPTVRAMVWDDGSGLTYTHVVNRVTGVYDYLGRLCGLTPEGTPDDTPGLHILATDHPNLNPSGWEWTVEWSNNAIPGGRFPLPPDGVVDLSTVVLAGQSGPLTPALFADLLRAAADVRAELAEVAPLVAAAEGFATDAAASAAAVVAHAELFVAPAKAVLDTIMGGDVADLVLRKAPKGRTLRPDMDSAETTDRDKLQDIIQQCIAVGYKTIVLDRMFDVTGSAPISIDKPNWHDRDIIRIQGNGGGIIKNDAGYVFTTGTVGTGDIVFEGLTFKSIPSAGAILVDADRMIRMRFSGNKWDNWDHLMRQTLTGRHAQSIRVLDETIIGGSGAFAGFRQSYDCTFRDCLVEDRLGKGGQATFVENTDGTIPGIANTNLRIVYNCIEGNATTVIRLSMCWSSTIDTNYIEYNGGENDPQIDLHTLATVQTGLTIFSNVFALSADQIAAHTPAILTSNTAEGDCITSSGNVASEGGVLYKFGPTGRDQGHIVGTGDNVLGEGRVVFPGQENRYTKTDVPVVTTATRPPNPRRGASVFDSTLGKLVTAKDAGTLTVINLQLATGATTSGTILVNLPGVSVPVPVLAGDTTTQVRDKIMAAKDKFFPVMQLTSYITDMVIFTAYVYGPLTATHTLTANGTGVTASTFYRDPAGTSAVWVDGSGTAV